MATKVQDITAEGAVSKGAVASEAAASEDHVVASGEDSEGGTRHQWPVGLKVRQGGCTR